VITDTLSAMTNTPEPLPALGPTADVASSSRQPSWRWRLDDAAGSPVALAEGEPTVFPSQSDAESWVGEVWRDLVDAGAESVTLFEGDREVYGPMSLRPAT
jgi:hypothetical protein